MQNHTENKVYAGFFVRLVAYAIDSTIIALALSSVSLPLSLAASSGAGFLSDNFLFHYSIIDIFSYLAVAAYFVLLTYFTHTTPGKAAMRLEVITADKEWTIWNIIYRETVGRFFSSLLCIGYFAVLVSNKKQGFHDMLCNTYVVYKGMQPKAKEIAEVVEPEKTDPYIEPASSEDAGVNEFSGESEPVVESDMVAERKEVINISETAEPVVTAPVYHQEQ